MLMGFHDESLAVPGGGTPGNGWKVAKGAVRKHLIVRLMALHAFGGFGAVIHQTTLSRQMSRKRVIV